MPRLRNSPAQGSSSKLSKRRTGATEGAVRDIDTSAELANSLSHRTVEDLSSAAQGLALSDAYEWRKLWGAMEPPSIASRRARVARLPN
jgi:hypothetical protein